MSFLELLKIEFMKVKRSKIVPLIFIAPLLVVASGVASLSRYFTPEYTNAWPAMFIQSAGLCVLPVAIQYDRCLRDDCRPGNRQQRYPENVGAAGQPIRTFDCQVLCAGILPVHGNDGVSRGIRNRRCDCDTDDGSNRNFANPVSAEMVPGVVSDNVAVYCSYVGNHGSV